MDDINLIKNLFGNYVKYWRYNESEFNKRILITLINNF